MRVKQAMNEICEDAFALFEGAREGDRGVEVRDSREGSEGGAIEGSAN